MLRLLRTRSHLTMAVARLIAASEPESAPVNTDVRTGYLEAPAPTLAAFETDAPHKTRDEQSDEERARLDAQTNDVLALLKAQQQQGE